MGKKKENYGDLLSKYLVEKISGKDVEWIQPLKIPWYKKTPVHYLTAGSIIHNATRKSIVWGSGIIDHEQKIAPADFRAVRGPRTRNYLLEQSYDCPEVYGDPALLLPLYYNPRVAKKYKIGIIPHYYDYSQVSEWYRNDKEIKVIDLMTMNVESVTKEILECEQTISSSLHGIIVSHAYGIPSVWLKFSDKLFGDGVKFLDYLESVGLSENRAELLKRKISLRNLELVIQKQKALPPIGQIEKLQRHLKQSQPF